VKPAAVTRPPQPWPAIARAFSMALAVCVCCASQALAQAGTQPLPAALALQPGPALQADGIPPLTRQPRAPAANDTPAAPRFIAWHPLQPQMLVLAPLGGSQQLHLLSGPGARLEPLTRGRDGIEGARFEPETGAYLVFRRDEGGNEAWRLWRLPAHGGSGADAVPITPAGVRISQYQFLPRGQGLVVVADRLDRDNPDTAEDSRQAHSRLLWLDPLQPGATRQLAEQTGGRFGNLQVGADGAVVVTRTVGRRTERLRFASPKSTEPETQPVDATVAEVQGEDVAWSAQALRGDFRHLVKTGLRSGARESLLTDIPAELDSLAAPAPGSGRPLALAYNERGFSALRLFDPGKPADALQPLASELPPGVVRALRWHPKLPVLAIEHVTAQSPGRLWVWDQERQVLRDWTGSPRPSAATELRSLAWTSFDGLQITGLHVTPPSHFSGPRPVFISLHGGPASQARPRFLSPLERRLVEQLGMHVIWPNVRGSDGFGKRFLTLDDGRKREDAVKDVSALLDLVARTPDMDATRVVVEGGSYGGYLSLAVAVHESARIAGNICQVGIANFVTFLEQTESYRRDNRRAEYGDERDPAMREFLLRISPVTRAAEIRKPLFVVHGRNDPPVPYGEAEQVVRAVRAQGTPVWFLTADDEGHGFKQAANRSYLLEATTEFVQRVIKGQPLQ